MLAARDATASCSHSYRGSSPRYKSCGVPCVRFGSCTAVMYTPKTPRCDLNSASAPGFPADFTLIVARQHVVPTLRARLSVWFAPFIVVVVFLCPKLLFRFHRVFYRTILLFRIDYVRGVSIFCHWLGFFKFPFLRLRILPTSPASRSPSTGLPGIPPQQLRVASIVPLAPHG